MAWAVYTLIEDTAMPTVRAYDDGERFWREVAEPLSARALCNNVFVGVANRIRADASRDLLRFGVFDDGHVVLGALRTPPFRLNLADLGSGEHAISTLAAYLAEHDIGVPGFMGGDRLAERFAEAWCALRGRQRTPGHGHRQNLYQVTRVEHPSVAGAMRSPRAGERDLLVAWQIGFAEDAGLPATEREHAFVERLVDEGLADGTFACWEFDGIPVSTARLRRIVDVGARVAGVYTPPALRGHGYASALTAALSQKVLDSGAWCCLFADAANPLTNRIYQRIGYFKLASFADILFADA